MTATITAFPWCALDVDAADPLALREYLPNGPAYPIPCIRRTAGIALAGRRLFAPRASVSLLATVDRDNSVRAPSSLTYTRVGCRACGWRVSLRFSPFHRQNFDIADTSSCLPVSPPSRRSACHPADRWRYAQYYPAVLSRCRYADDQWLALRRLMTSPQIMKLAYRTSSSEDDYMSR